MKIPIHNPKCSKCGQPKLSWINLEDNRFDEECSCGQKNIAFLDIRLTKGQRLLIRSAHESTINKDYCLSIVFSASAFEIDLRAFHHKWLIWNSINKNMDLPNEDPNEIFKQYSSIINKIKKTVKLAFPEGLNKYCKIYSNISEALKNFPSLNPESLAKDIQEHLFNPRNLILHSGKTSYGEEDAIKAYNISNLGMIIFESIDGSEMKI